MSSSSSNDSNAGDYEGDAYSQTVSGKAAQKAASESLRQQAIGDLEDRNQAAKDRMEQAGWKNALPGVGALNMLDTTIGTFSRNNMIDSLKSGGTPVYDNKGNVQGVYSNNGLFGGRVYSGNPDYGPGGGNQGGDNDGYQYVDQGQIELQKARDERATALAAKQKELSDAFGYFNDDYYNDLSQGYTDYSNPLLQTAYDDSLRGIYSGFKASGLLSQDAVDQAVGGLDSQRSIEQQRIADAASAYSGSKRTDVENQRKKLGDQLSSLVGGAPDIDSVRAQTDAINNFDVSGKVNKLKAAGPKSGIDFFSGFDKVAANQESNPLATYTNAPGAASASLTGSSALPSSASVQPTSLVGIDSPYSGSSVKVVS